MFSCDETFRACPGGRGVIVPDDMVVLFDACEACCVEDPAWYWVIVEVLGREINEAQHALVEASGSGAGVRVPFHGSGGRAG